MVTNSASEPGEIREEQRIPCGQMPATLFSESPDRRLTAGEIPGVAVHVTGRDKTVVKCGVRAIGSQELVLIVPSSAGLLTAGDLVTFSLWEGDAQLLTEQSGIAHWAGAEAEHSIVALFSGSRLDLLLDHRLLHERRADIRYPVDLRAILTTDYGRQEAQVVNYSLHGLCLVTETDLELNRHYHTDVFCNEGNLRLSVAPQWTRKLSHGHLIGCGLTPQYGMLLTCRHTSTDVTPENGPAMVS